MEKSLAKKIKTAYLCQNCGFNSAQWAGQCPDCKIWNSFVEEGQVQKSSKTSAKGQKSATPLTEISEDSHQRYKCGIDEFDRVLGGGIVPGSLILIGGEPGVGKSTLLTKLLGNISKLNPNESVLYVSGEESIEQIASRAKRLGINEKNFLLLHENSWEKIKSQIRKIRPQFFVLDSIQTTVVEELNSPPGTISQIREVTYELMEYTKTKNITTFVVGHITKDGAIAGPKILEHMVDTVVYFEGDKLGHYRLLRAIKNRFGNTNEVGVFEMSQNGLNEIRNPTQYFLQSFEGEGFGRSITTILEGTRTLFIEIQALVSQNKYGSGQRTTQGYDQNRLHLLCAVIEKYMGIILSDHDIYLNIVGGIKLEERESDLGVLASILSSIKGKPIESSTIFLGEVGLTGEIRPVPQLESRIREIDQLNYKRVVLPLSSVKELQNKFKVDLMGIKKVSQLEDLI